MKCKKNTGFRLGGRNDEYGKIFVFIITLLISVSVFAQYRGIGRTHNAVVPTVGTGTTDYFRNLSCGAEDRCQEYLQSVSNRILKVLNKNLEGQQYPRGDYHASIFLKLTNQGEIRYARLFDSSGFIPFERVVVDAAYETRNFGKVPWGLRKMAKNGQLKFGFRVSSK